MDDAETQHRRARLRELVAVTFDGRLTDLLAHIKQRTGKDANQGELSALQSERGLKSFGDKKAKTLTEQIGLPRHWFAMPLGESLKRTDWLQTDKLQAALLTTDVQADYPVQPLRSKAPLPSLEQALEVLALHINQIPTADREAAKSLLSALVNSPGLHSITAAGISKLCTHDSANVAAA